MGEPVLARDDLAARLEAGLRSLADPPPAVEPGSPAVLAEVLVRRGVIDWELADAALDAIRRPVVGPVTEVLDRLAGIAREAAARFEEHVLTEVGRLPSWYRVRIGDPDQPAGAWIERNTRILRVEVRGAPGPWPGAVSRAVVDEPVLLIVPGAAPTGGGVEAPRRRHTRFEVLSWDLDGNRLQQMIELLIAARHR